MFMGFGYNPDLANFGERLDILNFFAWMKRFQDVNWTIFDASGYAIVNSTPKKKITGLGKSPSARQILDALISEQERPKRAEIMQNSDLRSCYLNRLIESSGIEARYIDSREIFRESTVYQEAFDIALEFVKKLKVDNPDLVGNIIPDNPNPASQLYLPLEVAEAIFLKYEFEVGSKFGPTTEEDFDQAIVEMLEELGDSYETLRCSSGPRKPGYLSDRNVLWTSSPDRFVRSILQRDQEYRDFVSDYLEPFRQDESIENCAMRMRDQLRGGTLK